jgi:hypothetical protein
MSILQFSPHQLFVDDTDSDSDCEDEVTQKKEHERRQLSVLQRHDTAAYEAWLEITHQYNLLAQHCHLQDVQIENLTHQNELLSKINADLTVEQEQLIQDVMAVQEGYNVLKQDIMAVQDAYNALKQENTRLVDQNLEDEDYLETLIGELIDIQQKVADGVDATTLIIDIQEILTKDAIRKNGYV